jgi:endonuclease YncB( thermonuclease family)
MGARPGLLFNAVTVWIILIVGQATGSAQALPDETLIRVQDQQVSLYGLRMIAADQHCLDGNMFWQCGVKAQQALARRLDESGLQCKVLISLSSSGGTSDTAECWINSDNLNVWLVAQGWALTDGTEQAVFHVAEQSARNKRNGLWRGGFTPPESWRPAPAAVTDECSVCTARHRSIIRTRDKRLELQQATE